MSDSEGESSRRRVATPGDGALALLVMAVAVGVFWFHFVFLLGGRPRWEPDTFEYAEVARNIAAGRGIVSDAASVLEIARLGSHQLPIPYFVHDPGDSILLSGFFSILGVNEAAVGWASGTCFVLTVTLTYLLGLRLFNRRIGLLAAFLVGVNSQMNVASTSGLSEGPGALFVTLVFLLLCEARRPVVALAAGLATGALVVLRQNALPFVPFIFLVVAFTSIEPGEPTFPSAWKRGAAAALCFLLGFGALFVPNALRTAHYFGHPLHGVAWDSTWLCNTGAMQLTKAKDIWNTAGLNVDPVAYLASHPAELLEKMRYQITAAVSLLLAGGTLKASADAAFVGLFVLGVVAPRREGRQQAAIRWLVCVCLITAMLVGAAAFLRWRHLYVFLPVSLVYVAEVVDRILAAGTHQASPALRLLRGGTLAVIACAAGLLPAFTYPDHVARYEETVRTLARFVTLHTPEDAVVLVDVRPPVSLYGLAWYGRRQFITYSDVTLESLQAVGRPLYSLSAVVVPRGPQPLAGVGPRSREGFYRVARLQDPTTPTIALLHQRR